MKIIPRALIFAPSILPFVKLVITIPMFHIKLEKHIRERENIYFFLGLVKSR